MKTYVLVIFSLLLPFSSVTHANNAPCSGAKGGVNHCNGTAFVCNDGSTSSSKKSCVADTSIVQQKDFFVDHGGKPRASIKDPAATKEDFKPNYPVVKKVGKLLQVDYPGFTLWMDCEKRAAVKFQYVAHRDSGEIKRDDDFYLDQGIPASCQQVSSRAYGRGFDRGHLVPANHMDSIAESIHATNSMANILPQAANMNRGAWYYSEELVECYRDIDELLVIGGALWGTDSGSTFLGSHGIITPSFYWKVVIRGIGQDERAIAWVMPNSSEATLKNVDKYLVSIEQLEKMIGEKIPVADYVKYDKPSSSWVIPYGCNKG